MRIQRIVPLAFGLILLTLGNGCVTKALWQNDNLEAWNQPATEPALRLYNAKSKGDVLVVYDEYCERNGATHTRAYWLNENQKLEGNRHTPHFIRTNSQISLIPMPVLLASTNQTEWPPAPYAVLETNRQSFTLHFASGQSVPHDLPYYNDGQGKMEKCFFTPAAVTADLTIVGAVLGYIYLESQTSIYSYNPSY
jgi:hypothetical protein